MLRQFFSSIGRVTAVTLVVAGSCVECSTTSSDGTNSTGDISRVTLYDSLSDMSDDSTTIVVGTVSSQEVARDITKEDDFTISSFSVTRVVKGTDVSPGDVVKVRQIGSAKQQTGVEMLSTDQVYLLYLTPSGLTGDLASQYYVTGAEAGIYQDVSSPSSPSTSILKNASQARSETADSMSFGRVESDTGDTLPATVTLQEVDKQAQ
ncbi:hypothetical protein [Changpingibacter yushuensis]|uniref:hypothetical protein n=1 Tax=Changpingibacter yushuensis TaxID=2758440 RepID=UPI0015F4128E|nr:hypothetical protein [Changpingibacter yushuensis]